MEGLKGTPCLRENYDGQNKLSFKRTVMTRHVLYKDLSQQADLETRTESSVQENKMASEMSWVQDQTLILM